MIYLCCKSEVRQQMNDRNFTSLNKTDAIPNYNIHRIFDVANVNPNTVFFTILIVTVLVVIAGLTSSYVTYELNNGESTLLLKLFDLDEEQNIPTFFSYFLLNFCCFLLLIIHLQQKILNSRWSMYWLFLAIIFFILSFDEAASVHERFSLPVRNLFRYNRMATVWLDYSCRIFCSNSWVNVY